MRTDEEIKMLEHIEEMIKKKDLEVLNVGTTIQNRLDQRANPLVNKGDKVRKGKGKKRKYGRVSFVSITHCSVRWSLDQSITIEEISKLEKV